MQGHGQAQNALGYLCRRGLGVEQDYTKAVEWYQLASDQGVAQAAVAKERSATTLDSLALAQARVSDYAAAINSINEILHMEGRNSKYTSRLSLYQVKRPYQL